MAVASALSLAATGLSAVGSLSQGSATAAGDVAQENNANLAAQEGQVSATETDTSMRASLQKSLNNILAVRGSAGLDPMSPTGAAINNNVENTGNINRVQAVNNIQAQVTQDQNAAAFYADSANNAMTGGMLGALGGIFKGAAPLFGSSAIGAPMNILP